LGTESKGNVLGKQTEFHETLIIDLLPLNQINPKWIHLRTFCFLSPWKYCHTFVRGESKTETLLDFTAQVCSIHSVHRCPNSPECDRALIQVALIRVVFQQDYLCWCWFFMSAIHSVLLHSMLLEKNDQRNLPSPQGRDHEICDLRSDAAQMQDLADRRAAHRPPAIQHTL
jgi:hypothetical protein